MDDETEPPQARPQHALDKYIPKFVDKTEKLHARAVGMKVASNGEHKPAGGFDSTPIPHAPPGYSLKFTFHRGINLPCADFGTFSSDPYVRAQLVVDLPQRHKQDPIVTFRTPTVRKNRDPVWDSEWIVANVPASGFELKCHVYDEDAADHDDKLGIAYVEVGLIDDNWSGFKEQSFRVKKRLGSKRVYLFGNIAAFASGRLDLGSHLVISVECLGKTPGEEGGQMYTVGPNYWFKHFSPLIGRLTGTKDEVQSSDGKKAVSRYNLRGRILNRALHHQHERIYNFDRTTLYGKFEAPCVELTQKFLEFVHHAQGGRIFTYVLTLDGQFRFTETGKEFGIDLLSKHTMHSNVSIYIAYSGEFFVRRLKHRHRHHSSCAEPSATEISTQGPQAEATTEVSTNPGDYELFIDNDSGTYRPNGKYLPLLKGFLSRTFVGLHITTLDCQEDAERMTELKNEQREFKKKETGQMTFLQQRSSSSLSISSSDEEELVERSGASSKKRGDFARRVHDMRDVKGQVMKWVEGDAHKNTTGNYNGHSSSSHQPSDARQ
ncbi:hypothetical protein C2 [Aspergillus fumigatus]|nr:hypothetical protein C2 [Aspergillus fumigatus]